MNLPYTGDFNPGKKLHHVAVIFYCLYHKINIPLDIGIYKILSKDIHWLRSYQAACHIFSGLRLLWRPGAAESQKTRYTGLNKPPCPGGHNKP
jgi:hypothetical protein